ncbi:uncharacterized protein V1516DRAFT_142302 [Lipomyces oligophaga]|uniref:uncharacterized protein n=1 Tax=Lipomyces oligophaga TaxID=45792 RepID=UPI0034CE65A7
MSAGAPPNPPGWRPPKAPYDPTDPNELRPPQGYPSEYNAPIPKAWRVRATENPNYRAFVNRMRMEAYPGSAPKSDFYFGRTKVLRKVSRHADFLEGSHYTSMILCFAVVIYGTFFHRWNDGYSNAFSTPYRLQLRIKKAIFGSLSAQDEDDLNHARVRGQQQRVIDPETPSPADLESELALERPRRSHYLEAERAKQDLEELALLQAESDFESTARAVDLPAAATSSISHSASTPRKWFKFW